MISRQSNQPKRRSYVGNDENMKIHDFKKSENEREKKKEKLAALETLLLTLHLLQSPGI